MSRLNGLFLILAFATIISITVPIFIAPHLIWEFRDEPSRPGDYWKTVKPSKTFTANKIKNELEMIQVIVGKPTGEEI